MDKEIVAISGAPAAGKSTLTERYVAKGYTRLNRDTVGGSLDSLHGQLNLAITKGGTRFVLDNVYATRQQRRGLIEIGKRHNIPVKCVKIDTSLEDAQFNASLRMVRKYGQLIDPADMSKMVKTDKGVFPPAVLFRYRDEYEPPSVDEGFSEVVHEHFVRQLGSAYKNRALIVDYDGCLRETTDGSKYPVTPEVVKILPRRSEILKEYQKKGYVLLGVSNQSGIEKGDLTHEMAKRIFDHTNQQLGVDIDYTYCPHRVGAPFGIKCFCRKPMPGLGVHFIEKYQLDPRQTFFVGDMTSDKTFAARCGFQFVNSVIFFGDAAASHASLKSRRKKVAK